MKLRPRASFLLLLLIAVGLLWGWRQGQVSASGTRRDADGMRLRAVEGVEAVPSAAVLPRPALAAEAAVKPGSVRGYSMSRGFWKPQSPAPWPGVTPAATAQALYGCADFLHHRGDFDKEVTDHLGACFTPGLLMHFDRQRANLAHWVATNKDPLAKLPISEGSVFVDCYEGVSRHRLGKATLDSTGKRAWVVVHLEYDEDGKTYPWTDSAIFVKSGNVWLLDDIAFKTGGKPGFDLSTLATLRKSTEVK